MNKNQIQSMKNVNHSHSIWVLSWSNVVINFTTTNLIITIIIIVLLFYSFDVGIISLILPLTSGVPSKQTFRIILTIIIIIITITIRISSLAAVSL